MENEPTQLNMHKMFDAPPEEEDIEYCKICSDQEGGCPQCGWGREKKLEEVRKKQENNNKRNP